jgi:hypothetical protein
VNRQEKADAHCGEQEAYDGVAPPPGESRLHDAGHEEGAEHGADPVRGVQPVDEPRRVPGGHEGVDGGVDGARAQSGE